MWQDFQIFSREDGTFVVTHNGMPYHVTLTDPLIDSVLDYVTQNPDKVTPEIIPEPEPVEELPRVPMKVTPRQARLALLEAGLLDTVESILKAMPEEVRRAAWIEWEFASEIDRINPLFFILVQQLGLTEEDIDNLFIKAAIL